MNQKQASLKRFDALAKDAAHRLVRDLDLRIRQFVQTLHDHDRWPTSSREVAEKKKVEKKGLLFTRYEEKTVTRTVTEPERYIMRGHDTYSDHYRLRIFPNQEWRLFRIVTIDNDYNVYEVEHNLVDRTALGTAYGKQVGSSNEFVQWSGPDRRNIEPAIDLDALSNGLIKDMADYLTREGLPLPRD